MINDTPSMNVDNEPSTEPVLTLRDLRCARGLTAQELAERSGYANVSSVYHIERGGHPRLDQAVRLARTLDITLEQLAACIDESKARQTPAEPASAMHDATPGD